MVLKKKIYIYISNAGKHHWIEACSKEPHPGRNTELSNPGSKIQQESAVTIRGHTTSRPFFEGVGSCSLGIFCWPNTMWIRCFWVIFHQPPFVVHPISDGKIWGMVLLTFEKGLEDVLFLAKNPFTKSISSFLEALSSQTLIQIFSGDGDFLDSKFTPTKIIFLSWARHGKAPRASASKRFHGTQFPLPSRWVVGEHLSFCWRHGTESCVNR